MGGSMIKIFGYLITKETKLAKMRMDSYGRGLKDGEDLIKRLNFGWVNPVIHDLETLRANTWDQNKITNMQNWLKGMIERDK